MTNEEIIQDALIARIRELEKALADTENSLRAEQINSDNLMAALAAGEAEHADK